MVAYSLLYMQRSTTHSKQARWAARAGLGWRRERFDGQPSSSGQYYVKVEYDLDGRLEGWQATMRLDLHDGVVLLADGPHFIPPAGLSLAEASNRALKEFRFGNVMQLVEERLETNRQNLEEAGFTDDYTTQFARWIAGLRAMRRRPGRVGTRDSYYALVAQARVHAEAEAQPRQAIRWMIDHWKERLEEEPPSKSGVHALLNKATKRGLYQPNPPRITSAALKLLGLEEA